MATHIISKEAAIGLVKAVWSHTIGKKIILKKDFISVAKSKYPSRKDLDTLYEILQPFVDRVKKLATLKPEDLATETQKNSVVQKKAEQNFKKSFGDSVPWYIEH
ncbi:hypothetical protein KC866_00770 [Patescibacteria group bacterium]|nr:hypothetical protein [Patescibacteria group bacterium]